MMAEVELEVVEEEPMERDASPFLDVTRKLLLAGIGAMALAQDEMEAFVNRLVERGELAEKEGRQLLTDVMERRRQKTAEPVWENLDVRVERILQRMNIPTRNDINALSRQITALTKKLDELQKAQEVRNG